MSLLRVNGIDLGYDAVGEGTPVVLLHGYPLNRTMWRDQTEELRARYRIVTPDLRGHGETVAKGGKATMDEMAGDVAGLMDELKIERAVVGGLSMGGYVTLAFYNRFPQRTTALVLADTRPQSDAEEARKNRIRQAEQALVQGMLPIADALLPKALAASTLSEQPELVARVRKMMMSTDGGGAAAALRGMAARQDHTAMLPRINVPTLIIVGSDDAITPPELSKAMQREIRGAQLKIIEGAGHFSNIERPLKFNSALKAFLDGLHTS